MPAVAPRMPAHVRKTEVQLAKYQCIKATTTMLPRGVHAVTVVIGLLCCLFLENVSTRYCCRRYTMC